MNSEEILQQENNYLAFTKEQIEKEIEKAKIDIKESPERYKKRYSDTSQGDEDLLETLVNMLAERVKRLEMVYDAPYFAKMEFLECENDEKYDLYVGKTNVFDDNKNTIVIDWRAPICSLYYDQKMGRVSYEAPRGIVEGDLLSKKQIIIENGEVVNVIDSDTATVDDILLEYLSNNADARMKSIVASIQAEQNEIIRQPLMKNLIIQGVAGSGKTTVALHRIAYLIYNYSKNYKAENFCIIGPNKYFMNYISALLPDLDAEMVNQFTFEDLASKVLKQEVFVHDQSDILREYNSGNSINPALKLKCSWDYKEAIEKYWQDLIHEICGDGIHIDEVQIISEEDIRNRIMNSTLPLDENIKSFTSFLTNRIKNMQDTIYKQAKLRCREQLLQLSVKDPKRAEIINYLDELQKSLKDGYKKEIKKRFKRFTNDPIKLYKDFINNIGDYIHFDNPKELAKFKRETLKSISSKEFDYEDLPALMYLNILANGNDFGKDMIQVAVDEAQDFGIFHFYVMQQLFPNASFSTFGDMTQSLYSYRSIDSWQDLEDKVFATNGNPCEIMHMQKSYRNTSEIVENANNVSTFIGLAPAVPVIRHGSEVNYLSISEDDEYSVVEKLLEYIDKGYKSKAIICKTEEEVDKLYNLITKWDIPITRVTSKDEEYTGGNCILTSYLSKGLEFDAVILSDASEEIYNSNSDIDMKQLYVALTRSLHECSVFYRGELTKPLQNCIQLDKPKQLIKNI